jgi:hypothetical protein
MLSVSESLVSAIGAVDAPDTFVPPEVSIGGFGEMIGGAKYAYSDSTIGPLLEVLLSYLECPRLPPV